MALISDSEKSTVNISAPHNEVLLAVDDISDDTGLMKHCFWADQKSSKSGQTSRTQ